MNDLLFEKLNENPNLTEEEKLNFKKILNTLVKILPEKYYKELNNNINNFKICNNAETNKEKALAHYTIKENKIYIYKRTLPTLLKKAETKENKKLYVEKCLKKTIIHELFHMASSKYNYDLEEVTSGFDKDAKDSTGIKNKALTEGFTEFLATTAYNLSYKDTSYIIETQIVRQLISLIGVEPLFESYFNNHNIKLIKQELNKIVRSEDFVDNLFYNIEINFKYRNIPDKKNDILFAIQMDLLRILNFKLYDLEVNNKYREIEKLLNEYEKNLITKEILTDRFVELKKYNYINNSVYKFYELKEKYMFKNNNESLKLNK